METHRQIRVLSLGESEDHSYLDSLGPAERMKMVWQLTLQAWAYQGLRDEPRLQRDVVRVIRRGS
jgi:hypothetical protein